MISFLLAEPIQQLTADMFLNREERWLNENNDHLINSTFNNINQNNNILNPNDLRELRLQRNIQALRIIDLGSGLQRPPLIIRTHLFLPNRINNDFLLAEGNGESNFKFFLGFLVGIFLAMYALIFLIFCKFRPKFRLGLIFGMLLGSFLFLFYNLTNL